MSDTPRTDKFEIDYFNEDTSHVDDVFEYARKLERENAALRADKERLEWLFTWEALNWIYWKQEFGEWSELAEPPCNEPLNRDTIDARRREQS